MGWPMQKEYSQNKPARLKGVGDGYGVDGGMGVADGIAARVAATDWRICWFGSMGVAFGEQPADRNRIRLKVKKRSILFFILKLYPSRLQIALFMNAGIYEGKAPSIPFISTVRCVFENHKLADILFAPKNDDIYLLDSGVVMGVYFGCPIPPGGGRRMVLSEKQRYLWKTITRYED